MLEGRAVTQRDLDVLEEQANRNLMKFNMDICKVVPLRRKSTLQECRLQASRQFCSLWTLGVLVGSRLKGSPECAPAQQYPGQYSQSPASR